MTYSLVETVYCSASYSSSTSGFLVLIDRLFLNWMPSKGFTVEVWDGALDQKVETPLMDNVTGTGWYTELWVFVKKTITFRDGSTSDESFALEFEFNQNDLHWYAWDGVKATTDTSDPDYGIGTDREAMTNFYPISWNHYIEFWAESGSDAFFLRSVPYSNGIRSEST